MTRFQPTTATVTQVLSLFPFASRPNGKPHYNRLSAIHGLLTQGVKDPLVVHNGPGRVHGADSHFVKVGHRLVIKEPDEAALLEHRAGLFKDVGELQASNLVRYLSKQDDINKSTPANVVYWTSPCMPEMQGDFKDQIDLLNYFCRDVILGGYLVVQMDSGAFFIDCIADLQPERWDRIFYTNRLSNCVLPSRHVAREFLILNRTGK